MANIVRPSKFVPVYASDSTGPNIPNYNIPDYSKEYKSVNVFINPYISNYAEWRPVQIPNFLGQRIQPGHLVEVGGVGAVKSYIHGLWGYGGLVLNYTDDFEKYPDDPDRFLMKNFDHVAALNENMVVIRLGLEVQALIRIAAHYPEIIRRGDMLTQYGNGLPNSPDRFSGTLVHWKEGELATYGGGMKSVPLAVAIDSIDNRNSNKDNLLLVMIIGN